MLWQQNFLQLGPVRLKLRVRRLECNFTAYSLHTGDRSLSGRDSSGQRRHWDVHYEKEKEQEHWRKRKRQKKRERAWRISPRPEFDPRTVKPVASRYIDWAIPSHTVLYSCELSTRGIQRKTGGNDGHDAATAVHITYTSKQFLTLSMYSYCSSMYSYYCLCIPIVRPCILIVVYVFLLFVHVFLTLSMYSYCSSMYS